MALLYQCDVTEAGLAVAVALFNEDFRSSGDELESRNLVEGYSGFRNVVEYQNPACRVGHPQVSASNLKPVWRRRSRNRTVPVPTTWPAIGPMSSADLWEACMREVAVAAK